MKYINLKINQKSLYTTLFTLSCFLFLFFTAASDATAQSANTRFRGMMLSSEVTSQDIDDLKEWGANLVRYQLGWNSPEVDTANEQQYRQWLAGALNHMDAIIEAARKNGMKVLVNLHTPPGGYSIRKEPAQYRLFKDKWTQQLFIQIWGEIAQRYKDNETIWAFQLANEPAFRSLASGLDNWNKLALKAARKIREFDDKHMIVMTPHYGDTARLGKLKKLRVKNVAYSVHMYFPRQITNQGILGYKYGLPYPSLKYNKTRINKYLKKLIKFKRDNKVQILIHEFSVIRWAPNGGGARYLKDAIEIFEKNKFHWVYHAFREANVWSLEHTDDRNSDAKATGVTDRAQVVRSYFAKNLSR